MTNQTKLNTDSVIPIEPREMKPFVKSEYKIQNVNLTSIIDRTTEINKIHFDIALIVFSKLNEI